MNRRTEQMRRDEILESEESDEIERKIESKEAYLAYIRDLDIPLGDKIDVFNNCKYLILRSLSLSRTTRSTQSDLA